MVKIQSVWTNNKLSSHSTELRIDMNDDTHYSIDTSIRDEEVTARNFAQAMILTGHEILNNLNIKERQDG